MVGVGVVCEKVEDDLDENGGQNKVDGFGGAVAEAFESDVEEGASERPRFFVVKCELNEGGQLWLVAVIEVKSGVEQ